MSLILLLLACADPPYDPVAECEAEGRACCSNSACAEDEICHFVYTCTERAGELSCSEPTGDRACHQLCSEGDGEAFVCEDPTQTCQQVEFVQGGDSIGSETACF